MRFNPKGEDDVRSSIDDYPHEDLRKSYIKSRNDWDPQKHDDEILRVSKSSLGTFGWCPKQYWFTYFEKIEGETVYYHTRGLNVHDAMEYFWENVGEVRDEIFKLLDEGHRESARKMMHDVIPAPPEPYAYGEEEQIRQWVDWQFSRFEHTNGADWEPVGCEAEIHASRIVEVDGEPIPIHIKGYIDSIFSNGDADGTFALMELKTGKWKNAGGRKKTSMRKEMQFYKMMLENSPHHEYLPITHWGWEFPGGGIEGGDGPHIYFEPVKDAARFTPKSVEKSLINLVQAHVDGDFPMTGAEEWWNAKEGRMQSKCEWCDYMEICPTFTGEEL